MHKHHTVVVAVKRNRCVGWWTQMQDVCLQLVQHTWRETFVLAVLLRVDEHGHPLVGRRVFIGGFSQGAIMSECVALTQPRLVAGAVLMSGRTLDLLHRHDLQPAAGYPPMIVVHGTVDRVLSIDEGRATQSFLQALAVDFEYREYPMAHQISDESLDEIDTWLSAHLDASESL